MQLEADVCIYGGTSAGVIAAYSAHMLGKSVILIEPGSRLGGLTTGGLGQTDIGNKYAVTGLSRDFYRRLGREYGTFEQWFFEPKVALKVYHDLLDQTDVNVIYTHRLNRVHKKKTDIRAICLENSLTPDSIKTFVKAKVFIDCSYEGDLMARSGVKYLVGRESNDLYNETYNGVQLREHHQFPDSVDPYVVPGDPASGLLWGISEETLEPAGTGDRKVQAYNYRICLTDSVENMIPITRPDDYDSTRYELFLRLIEKTSSTDMWPHFIWSRMPGRKTDINNRGAFSTDMIGMNWSYPEASYKKRQEIIDAHTSYTKGLLYFIGHDPRLPEAFNREMQQWGYPKDEYTEHGHFTPQLYVREARRMVGEYVMTEHNCTGALTVDDAIGMAAYTMDSHNCQRLVVDGMVKNEGDVQIGGFPPYPIAYRSITPQRAECTNLLVPVDLSATHIAYGSIRMEPVFMVLGQAAGVAAAMAIDDSVSVQTIDVPALQQKLREDPLLDGSRPEIVIDNQDTTMIELEGAWELKPKIWTNRAYVLDYLLNTDQKGKRKVIFTIDVQETGMYDIYYYCPDISREIGDGTVADRIPFMISSGDKVQRGSIDFRNSQATFYHCGQQLLQEGDFAYFEADGSGVDGAWGADALLLVPR